MEKVELDDVELAPKVLYAWQFLSERTALQAMVAGVLPEELPIEQAERLEDGSLRIFVELPRGLGEVSLTVPPEGWRWRPSIAN